LLRFLKCKSASVRLICRGILLAKQLSDKIFIKKLIDIRHWNKAADSQRSRSGGPGHSFNHFNIGELWT